MNLILISKKKMNGILVPMISSWLVDFDSQVGRD